ncbi:hypothetical protein [Methanoculleus horonobensis]|uniref:hypothetical protein n=1 Tax=Methanoculleus horonobensis TaxID=528314 RepID=UPI0013723672|nr:hypothetical protein [Methanoculleus horonobensis]
MSEQKNWRDLLYPAEWGFRFFITAALVWLIGREWHEPIAMAIFYALLAVTFMTLIMQAQELVRFIRAGRENVGTHQ